MRTIVWALLIVTAAAVPVAAQETPPGHWASDEWIGEVAFASASAVLAGVSAGLYQVIRKGSFKDGFAAGALGGAVAYGGRRLVVEDFPGAGLLGRQVSAVGLSITRNAGDGNPLLSRVWLPFGPFLLRVDSEEAVRVSPTVDILSLAWLTAAGFDARLQFDARASLSSGAPVFQAQRHRLRSGGDAVNGIQVAGLIVLDQPISAGDDSETLGHERVHVLQYDFAQLLWNDPAEGYLLGLLPRGRAIGSVARVGVIGYGLSSTLPSMKSFWQAEAHYLDRR